MTVIYLDTLFLLDLAVDYLLLLASARVAGETLERGRYLLGALFGSAYAAACFLPGCGFLLRPSCRISACIGMLVLAYGARKRTLRTGLVFLGIAAAFGGGIYALSLSGGRGSRLTGTLTDVKTVLLSAAGCYAFLGLVFRRAAAHSARELASVEIVLGTRCVKLTALVDTGNALTDPVSGAPVLVAEGEKLARLFPEAPPTRRELLDPVGTMERRSRGELASRWRLLPYRAVGTSCGLLLALRCDAVRINGREQRSDLVALSPDCLSDGGGYCALIGAGEEERGWSFAGKRAGSG